MNLSILISTKINKAALDVRLLVTPEGERLEGGQDEGQGEGQGKGKGEGQG